MPQLYSKNQSQTKQIAADITKKMGGKGLICLYGTLGAGKTIFAKGCGLALGIPERRIKSPSFTYVREYQINGKKMYHCDFYRINAKNEYIRRMFDELKNNNALFVIEWPGELNMELPTPRVDVFLEIKDENTRKITMKKVV